MDGGYEDWKMSDYFLICSSMRISSQHVDDSRTRSQFHWNEDECCWNQKFPGVVFITPRHFLITKNMILVYCLSPYHTKLCVCDSLNGVSRQLVLAKFNFDWHIVKPIHIDACNVISSNCTPFSSTAAYVLFDSRTHELHPIASQLLWKMSAR